jgi:hypothetical protein
MRDFVIYTGYLVLLLQQIKEATVAFLPEKVL